MVGTIDVVISNDTDRFHMSFKRKYNIIDCSSGVGKTYFMDLLRLTKKRGTPLAKVISSVPCRIARSYAELKDIPKDENCIVFMDESNVEELYNEDSFKQLRFVTEDMSAYFVFVTRYKLVTLPISCSCIYYFYVKYVYGTINEHYLEQRYEWVNEVVSSPDVVIVEDSGSGLDFYKRYFNCSVVSSHGNSNLYSKVLSCLRSGMKTVIVVGDSAGLGSYIKELLLLQSVAIEDFGAKVFLFLPESFEYILLRSRLFLGFIDENVLINTQDYAETSKYLSWERYYTSLVIELSKNYGKVGNYSKSSLSRFYLTDKNLKALADAADEVLKKGW